MRQPGTLGRAVRLTSLAQWKGLSALCLLNVAELLVSLGVNSLESARPRWHRISMRLGRRANRQQEHEDFGRENRIVAQFGMRYCGAVRGIEANTE